MPECPSDESSVPVRVCPRRTMRDKRRNSGGTGRDSPEGRGPPRACPAWHGGTRAVARMEIRPSEAEADLDVVVGEALVAATLAHRADEVDTDRDGVVRTDLAQRQALTEPLLATPLGLE
jgi:hypothetical protein